MTNRSYRLLALQALLLSRLIHRHSPDREELRTIRRDLKQRRRNPATRTPGDLADINTRLVAIIDRNRGDR
jgi:hypothetical protein